MDNLNANIVDADEIFAECSRVPSFTFKNSRKLSIFGKSSMESHRTTDFTLSSKIDEDQAYEKKRTEEIESWVEVLADARDQYLRTKQVEPELTIDDLPENYRNFLKDQIDFVNLHNSSAMDKQFQDTYTEFAKGAKLIESKKNFIYEFKKSSMLSNSANVKDKLFS